MMLKKRIDQLKFEDVVAFLAEQHEEGVHLDYKLNMISADKVAKLASAFANSSGGVCIFGVNETDELPTAPYEGANLGNDPRQLIKQACHSQLTPPLEPIVGPLLMNPVDSSKAFLVLGIPQSGNAPHATTDGRVYLKFQDHKEPVQPSLAQYERLLQGRAACRADRDRIVREAIEDLSMRTNNWPVALRPALSAVRDLVNVEIKVSCAYPDGSDLATPQQLVESIPDYRVHIANGGNQWGVPGWEKFQLNTFGRGAFAAREDQEIAIAAVIHCEGAFVARAALPIKTREFLSEHGAKKNGAVASAELICAICLGLLRSALRCFQTFGCYSSLVVQVRIGDETTDGHFIVNPKFPDRNLQANYPLGPSRSGLLYNREIPWASESELSRVEREIVVRYISSFNVQDTETAESFVRGTLKMVNTAL